MSEKAALPAKRTEILFSRITKRNKDFIVEMSEKRGVSEAVLIDWLITKFRNKESPSAGDAKKSKRSA